MKKLFLIIILLAVKVASAQFLLPGASAGSPPTPVTPPTTPNAAAPINTVGITNNGNFTQNSNCVFNGTINANQDIKVTTNADINQNLNVGGNSELNGDLKVVGKTEFQNDNCFKGDKTIFDKNVASRRGQLSATKCDKNGCGVFRQGKSAIGTDAEAQILNVLDRVKAMPKAMHIYIVGSNSKEGNDRLNLMLATQRAIGVRDLILKHGIGKNKVSILPINADNIIPIDASGSDAAKRRVEIWLLEER